MSKRVWFGIIMAAVVLGMGTFLIFFLSLFFNQAEAAEYPFPEAPYAYMGLESESKPTFCDAPRGNLVANTGFGQVVYRNQYVDLTALFTHHSCAFREDKNSYNAVGLQFKWYPWNGGRYRNVSDE